jgi:hypothetical protein
VSAVADPETFTAPTRVERVKFQGLLINGDLPHAYFGRQIVSFQNLKALCREGEVGREPVCNLFKTLRSGRNLSRSNNNDDNINKEVLRSPEGEIKTQANLMIFAKCKPELTSETNNRHNKVSPWNFKQYV